MRCSRQRLWLEPSGHGLVLEQVFLNPARQSATFIGAAELLDKDGNLLRAGEDSLSFTLSIRSTVVSCDLSTCGASFTSRTDPSRN